MVIQGTGEEQWVAVNFDVPDHGNTLCHINFHLNTNANKNAPTKLQGDAPYSINISRIDPKLANGGTTWETVPNVQEHVATFVLDKNGASEVVGKWFVCPKNVAQFIIQPASQRDMEVYWYELDYTQADGGAHGITLEMWA
ncbi:ubiquitin 3 binding But2 [Pyrenophora seminiperda CCB06]|uniref:Ubiquitin 3 binding But2 n=1 Tax=Pyrenophora seminiperda CCB06 TaxID=1302712 RepID=A0A3M7MDN8_9PLEO|nr:ubiquitin 3 binding But2 [Pyrenophora seminiperda CCB06]